MTLLWLGLLISGSVIVLVFVWSAPPPSGASSASAKPDTSGVPGAGGEPAEPSPSPGAGTNEAPHQRGQKVAAVALAALGATAFPTALHLGEGHGFDALLTFFGVFGFSVGGLAGGALGTLWGPKTSLGCLILGSVGVAAVFLGSLASGIIG